MGLAAEVVSSILLFGLVLGMSATVELHQVARQLRNRTALLIGLCLQFVLLPFVGFLVVKIFQFPSAVGITLLVVTSSPGGSYSNWWCSLFNASLALSVTMTAISTLLSTVMLPINLMIYTRWAYSSDVVQSLDWRALFVSLVVVLGGIASGLVGGRIAKQRGQSEIFHRRANLFGNISGLALITLSITVSSTSHQAALWDQDAAFYIGCALPAMIGLAVATYLATRFDLAKPERVAVAVESCYQNTGIATSVAITMFGDNENDLATAIGVPLYYGLVVAVMLAVFCVVCWKLGWTKAPRNENFCKMLYNSYEVEVDHGTQEAEVAIEVVYGAAPDGGGGERPSGDANVVFQHTDNSSYVVDDASLHKVKQRDEARSNRLASQSEHQHQHQRNSTGSSDEETAACSEDNDGDRCHDDPDGEAIAQTGEDVGRLGRTIAVLKARATGYRTPHALTRPRSTDEDDKHDVSHGHSHPQHPVTYDPRILSALDENDDDDVEVGGNDRRHASSSATSPGAADATDSQSAAQSAQASAPSPAAPSRLTQRSYHVVPMNSSSPDEKPGPSPRLPVDEPGQWSDRIPAQGRTID
jgi:predicted Na+-dependent transporter